MISAATSDAWMRHLAGEALAESDRDTLIAACQDEQIRRRLLEDLRLDGMLRAHVVAATTGPDVARACAERIRAEDNEPQARRMAATIHRRLTAEARRPHSLFGRLSLLGGCAAALVVAAVWWTVTGAREDLPHLRTVTADVQLTHDGIHQHAQVGSLMRATDVLDIPHGREVSVQYADGTVCTITGDARLVFSSSSHGKHIDLERGTLTAQVAKQPSGMPMRISSAVAMAEIVGTTLTVSVEPTGTRLDVQDGRVRFLHDDRTVDVSTGQSAIATTSGLFRRVSDGGNLVTAMVPGRRRTDWVGWNGARITIGEHPLIVRALGRLRLVGNHVPRGIKLVDASTGQDVPETLTIVDWSTGDPGQTFVFGSLSHPVVLTPHRSYYLVYQTDGTEPWCHSDTQVTTTAAAHVDRAVFSVQDRWMEEGSDGQTFGPVTLRYDPILEPVP